MQAVDSPRPYSALSLGPPALVGTSVKLFSFALVISGLMTYVPDLNVGTGLFVFAFGICAVHAIIFGKLYLPDGRTAAVILFLFYSLVSLLVLIYGGYGFPEWSRAIVPFLFLGALFFLPQLNEDERRYLAFALLVASLVWMVKIFIEAGIGQMAGKNVFGSRLTFNVIDSVLPFPLVAIPYLLFVKSRLPTIVRWGLLAMLIYLYVWIGYRGGLIIVAGCFAVFSLANLRRFGLLQILGLLAIVVAIGSLGVLDDMQLADRFETLSNEQDSSRALEWSYAFEQFASSPVVGKGIGWQVPAEITFYGVGNTDGEQAAQVGYVHTSLGYFAMTMGVIGIVLYYFITLPRSFKITGDDILVFSSVALAMLFFFCLTQATFRLVQTVLMMVALIRLNVRPTYSAKIPIANSRV